MIEKYATFAAKLKAMETLKTKTKTAILGETALDLGKLTFAGIVLAGIFDSNFNQNIVVLGGLVLCAAFIVTGLFLTTKK